MNGSVMFQTIAATSEHLVTSFSTVKSLLTSVNAAMKFEFDGNIERLTTNITTKRFQS